MQIFPRSSNAIARASLVLVVLAVGGLSWVVLQLERTPYITNAGVRKAQPVPFSHQHHVTGLGIDCRYCHTSVEQSSFAGIPPTKTCINCHQQIWTNAAYLEPVRESFRTGRCSSGRALTSCRTLSISTTASTLVKGWGVIPVTAPSIRCR